MLVPHLARKEVTIIKLNHVPDQRSTIKVLLFAHVIKIKSISCKNKRKRGKMRFLNFKKKSGFTNKIFKPLLRKETCRFTVFRRG